VLVQTVVLHSTFPAGASARAHGLRAEAGAPFLSFFLSYKHNKTITECGGSLASGHTLCGWILVLVSQLNPVEC
jgi:hypothetical protein